MSNVGDVNIGARATNTVMLFNGSEYIHVTPSQILDLADGTDDDSLDYGGF